MVFICYIFEVTENQVMFAMVQPTNFIAQAVLTFSSTVFNIGGGVNSTTNTLVVPRCGLYWTHVEVRTASYVAVADLSIVSTHSQTIGVLKNSTNNFDFTVLSRQDLRWISAGTQMYASSPAYGGQYWFWEGFNIAGLMNPLIAFNVYNNLTITAPTSPQPFPFSNVQVNEGGGWNSFNNTFTAPASGIYVLSYTTACTANIITKFYLFINNTPMFNAEVSDTAHEGVDMATRCLVIGLDKGQSIWITGDETQSYGSQYQMSSFKGFYISPIRGTTCAWSVYSPLPGTAWTSLLSVAINDITFDSSTVNVTIPYAGIYYISLTTTNTNPIFAASFKFILIQKFFIHIQKYLHDKVHLGGQLEVRQVYFFLRQIA